MEFYEEHFEPKTFELGLTDREIFAKKAPKKSKKQKLWFPFIYIDRFLLGWKIDVG